MNPVCGLLCVSAFALSAAAFGFGWWDAYQRAKLERIVDLLCDDVQELWAEEYLEDEPDEETGTE